MTSDSDALAGLLTWHRRYLAFVASLEATASLVGVWIIRTRESLAANAEVEATVFGLFGALWILTMLFLALVHVAAVRTPREPWAWTIHAIVLGLDLTTLVLWPFALPLLWRWMKDDVRRWYGLPPRRTANDRAGASDAA